MFILKQIFLSRASCNAISSVLCWPTDELAMHNLAIWRLWTDEPNGSKINEFIFSTEKPTVINLNYELIAVNWSRLPVFISNLAKTLQSRSSGIRFISKGHRHTTRPKPSWQVWTSVNSARFIGFRMATTDKRNNKSRIKAKWSPNNILQILLNSLQCNITEIDFEFCFKVRNKLS